MAKFRLWLKRLALGTLGFLALYFLLILASQQYIAHKFLQRIEGYPKPPLQRILPPNIELTDIDASRAYSEIASSCLEFGANPTEASLREFSNPTTLIEILQNKLALELPPDLASAFDVCGDNLDKLVKASRSNIREPIASHWPFVPLTEATSVLNTPNYIRLYNLTKALRVRAVMSKNVDNFLDSLATSFRIVADQGLHGNGLSAAIVNIYSAPIIDSYALLLSKIPVNTLGFKRIITDLNNLETHLVSIKENWLGEYAFTQSFSLPWTQIPYVDQASIVAYMQDTSPIEKIYRYSVNTPFWAIAINKTYENLIAVAKEEPPIRYKYYIELLGSRQRFFYNFLDLLLDDGATVALTFNIGTDIDREALRSKMNAIRLLATSLRNTPRPTTEQLTAMLENVDPLTGQSYKISSFSDGITIESKFNFDEYKTTFPSSRSDPYKIEYRYH